MSVIWRIHRMLRGSLPKPVIQFFRRIFERYSDSLWVQKSYSYSGEDRVMCMLIERMSFSRGGVQELIQGFYVDVGAFAPKQFSNTYLLYKKGWRGINIDAAPGSMVGFRQVRPRDINVEAAVSDTEAVLDFYTWGTPMVVNTLSKEHAEEFARRLGKAPQIIRVHTATLASLLDTYLPSGQSIDFMNVDVEDHDLQVLQSNNWEKYSPTFVMVEVEKDAIQDILQHPITAFMHSKGYTIASWVYPNIIFERSTDGAPST